MMLLLTLDDGENNVVIDELLSELLNPLLFLDDLRLLCALLLRQVLHISITETSLFKYISFLYNLKIFDN